MISPEIVNLASSDDETVGKLTDDRECVKEKSQIPQPANTATECSKQVKITVKDKKMNSNMKNKTKFFIEIDEQTSSQETNVNSSSFNKISSLELENEDFTLEFSQMIELCLQYEFSDGMVRIIKKNLIPYYKAADKGYLESIGFQRFLEDIVKKLQEAPQFKFSHLKIVCENLKQNQYKKRVNLVTLDNKVSDHRKRRYSQSQVKPRVKRKQPKISEVIDLDVEESVIDVDAEQDDVIFVDKEKENTCTDGNIENQSQINSLLKDDVIFVDKEKENTCTDGNIENQSQINSLLKDDVIFVDKEKENTCTDGNIENQSQINSLLKDDVIFVDKEKENTCTDGNIENQSQINSLLKVDVIFVAEEKENTCTDVNIQNQIQTNNLLKEDLAVKSRVQIIEKEIEVIHKLIKRLEEAEVIDDISISPYILGDAYKERILELYKEYCSLMGQEYYQRRQHKVMITVADGHPPGPSRKLTEWLNANTNEYGEPQFPDFINVVKCVTFASEEEGLGLNKKQVLAEARMLFTLCGKALQERRQKHEWRDLKCKVKDIEHDPADNDPELMARLDANRQLAMSKEAEILEHYAKIPYRKKKTKDNKTIVVLQSTAATSDINSYPITNPAGEGSETNTDNANTPTFYFPEVPVLYNETIAIISESNATEIPIKSEPCLVPRPIDPNIEIVCSDSEDYSTSENEDSDFELDNILPADDRKIDSNEEETKSNNNDNLETNKENSATDIKPEIKTEIEFSKKALTAEETLKMLLQFDSNEANLNVTTTILDPENLVTIEILSDSDSDTDYEFSADDENTGLQHDALHESQVESPLEPQDKPTSNLRNEESSNIDDDSLKSKPATT